MARQGLVWIIFAAWVLLALASVLVPMSVPATDFGMTRGLNRLAWFAQLQLASIALAIPCFFLARRLEPGWKRWLARLPLILELALALVVVGLIVWSNLQRPDPGAGAPAPTRPVTEPAPGGTALPPKPEG